MDSEQLFEEIGHVDLELVARADMDASLADVCPRERKQHWLRRTRYFFAAAACLLLLFVLAKLLN